MKILMIAGQFYPDLAGSGIATHSIALDLAKRGHDVTVCVDSTNEYLDKVKSNPPFSLKFIPDFKSFMTGHSGFRRSTEAIYDVLKDEEFDIVHVYSYMPMLLLSLMNEVISSPIIFTFWNAPSKGERALGLYKSAELDLQLARQIIALNRYERMILGSVSSFDSAIELGADPQKTTYKYHGIEMHDFTQKRKDITILSDYFDHDFTSKDTIVTLPGRITERKGVYEAVRALALTRKTHNIKLFLTSTGRSDDLNAINTLRNLARELNVLDDLIFSKKMIPQAHMPLLYQRSDIIIVPSYYEGLGFTAVEALACARPLVVTNVQGLDEVGIHDVNCLVIPPKNEVSLAAAIIKLIDDPALAQRLSQSGPNSVKKFDMRLFVDHLITVYEEYKEKR